MNLITPALQVLLFVLLLARSFAETFAARFAARARARGPAGSAGARGTVLGMVFFSAAPASGVARIAMSGLLWLSAVATLAGIFIPFAVFFAACLSLIAALFLAVRAVRSKGEGGGALIVMLAVLSIVVGLLQPLGLKVLALPKADDLPFVPGSAQVLKTYDEGLWFEGIAAGNDGALYLAGNRGIDFSRRDYYHNASGELIRRTKEGTESVLFTTPHGTTAGVVAVAADGTIYLTSHGDAPCIWRVDTQGVATRLVEFPQGAWPNGLDFGPDGMLYTPDSNLGVIWRVDPTKPAAIVALRDALLLARPYIALAPGANGLHFSGRDLIVTVSDRTTVLKFRMDAQGQFGPANIVATGIPGDDFAIGRDGTLFITTHPYDTLVRVAPNGDRSIIGKAAQHMTGATDAVFGKREQDQDTLYIVTDGGALSGGPKTRGQLVALTIGHTH